MKIEWKEIKDYPYLVSNTGEIYSLKAKKNLSPGRKRGYLSVILQNKGKKKQSYVHRLVAEYFLPPSQRKTYVNHIDGVKDNNAVTNLEWVTPLENTRHAIALGLYNNSGENNGRAKLKPKHVEAIRLLKGVLTQKELSDLFMISESVVSDIHTNKKWRDNANK